MDTTRERKTPDPKAEGRAPEEVVRAKGEKRPLRPQATADDSRVWCPIPGPASDSPRTLLVVGERRQAARILSSPALFSSEPKAGAPLVEPVEFFDEITQRTVGYDALLRGMLGAEE